MKKLAAVFLMIVLLLGAAAFAEDLGIQIIGGPDMPEDTLSLDDMKIGDRHKISGYATIDVLDFYYADVIAQWKSGKVGSKEIDSWINGHDNAPSVDTATTKALKDAAMADSGETAEFALLKMDITNLQKVDYMVMANAAVKVIYDEEYEFAGWVRQTNYDYYSRIHMRLAGHEGHSPLSDAIVYDTDLFILPGDEEPVGMMYTGHYTFGCTLPNEVVKDKAPLRMEITLGENVLTYHIRK